MDIEKYYMAFFFIVVLVLILFILIGKKKKKAVLSNITSLNRREKIIQNYSSIKQNFKNLLLVLAAIMIVVGLMNPRWGISRREIKRKGSDIVFLIDTSLSMKAEDVSPSRFQKALYIIEKITENIDGSRVGIVAFAGDAYLYCPLTLDYAAFNLFLKSLEVGFIPVEGTDISTACEKALNSFEQLDSTASIFLFSDGEDHAGGINKIIDKCENSGVSIYSFGCGTLKGAPIPISDTSPRKYKEDNDGVTVISKLNDVILRKLSKETGGTFLPLTSIDLDLNRIKTLIDNLKKREIDDTLIQELEDKFYIFLSIAFILLIMEYIITDRKRS